MMVLAEEFGSWEDSQRRIDLLCLDKDRQLVVVELKRTENGGHMELQALRYAAMISTMRFEQAVDAFAGYRECSYAEAESVIRGFLDIPEGDVVLEATVPIILVAANFAKEITSTVLWLNSHELDITCIRAVPHKFQKNGVEHILLDVQQIIPLPEAAAYQIAIREKRMDAVDAQRKERDITRYNLRTRSGKELTNLPKRRLILHVVKEAIHLGLRIEKIREAVHWRISNMFIEVEGKVSGAAMAAQIPSKADRYFCEDDELIFVEGKTYALSNRWGDRTESAIRIILDLLPKDHGIEYARLT